MPPSKAVTTILYGPAARGWAPFFFRGPADFHRGRVLGNIFCDVGDAGCSEWPPAEEAMMVR
jgi:hypothetical protein